MYWTNYHSHCEYCDGTDKMEAYIHEAISQKLKVYGFSSHAPLTFPVKWCMRYDKVSQYLEEAAYLKQKFSDLIQIYVGMEVDFIPGVTGPTSNFIKSLRMDYVVGSIHFSDELMHGKHWEMVGKTSVFKEGIKEVYHDNIKKAVKRYYELVREMLDKQCPEIVGHVDKIKIHNRKKEFFSESDAWYQKEVIKTLESIAQSGSILEVNTLNTRRKKSFEIFPSPWILKEAIRLKIPIMLNSDCHEPSEITLGFKETAGILEDIGYKEVKILLDGEWQSRPFSKKGIKID